MDTKTQKQWIVKRLVERGSITRNECLRNYISRLGARICDLKKDGWKFETQSIRTKHGTDFKYIVERRG